jgi:hypothetical protein
VDTCNDDILLTPPPPSAPVLLTLRGSAHAATVAGYAAAA